MALEDCRSIAGRSLPGKDLIFICGLCLALLTLPPLKDCAQAAPSGSGCTAAGCHADILPIVPPDLPMMKLIRQNGLRHKDMDGCVICHGGDPSASDKQDAHGRIPKSLLRAPGPKAFYPNPGALHIAQNTCGICHPGYVYRVERSLMNTGAGKIQGNLSTWGVRQGDTVTWGNHDIDDPDGPVPSGTTLAYESYMAELKKAVPGPFPDRLTRLPLPSLREVEAEPAKAAFIFQRKECQSCHLKVKGRQIPGNFRGTGCGACHIRYGIDGIYRGKDQSIPKTAGHILTHRIDGNRKTGGIPVSTCQSCHNRGKRIGTSFAGLMESAFPGGFDKEGTPRPPRHGTHYIPVKEDLHHREKSRKGNPEGGLLCQDCHTSMDVHGDGNLKGTTLAQVEIECTDCHGTPEKFPWELFLGHGDEFGLPGATPRGTAAARLMSGQQFGFDYDGADGYLLSARGNPLGNVVRMGNRVIVHSAAGKDFYVPVLKALEQEETPDKGRIAMAAVPAHLKRLECYTCHAAWVPQCYGCHIKMDFSDPSAKGVDWISVSNDPDQAESAVPPPTLSGRIEESLSYVRWENPVLGINGEGRVSPLMPGCQAAFTVIGTAGQVLSASLLPANPPEAKAAGQTHIPLAMDMAPAQPHTSAATARSCESCHTLPKTVGLGIGGGQFKAMTSAPYDFSKLIDSEGTQLVTVGSHWPASRAFNKPEMEKILRTGTCMGCHGAGQPPKQKRSAIKADTRESHRILMETMLKQLGQRHDSPSP